MAAHSFQMSIFGPAYTPWRFDDATLSIRPPPRTSAPGSILADGECKHRDQVARTHLLQTAFLLAVFRVSEISLALWESQETKVGIGCRR